MKVGFNPLHYSCEMQGCFNKKHRLKFEVFFESLPGRISFTDIDGITEVAGNALMIEWKSKPGSLPTGQRIMFERITKGQMISVICVAGDAQNMNATHFAKVFNGKVYPWNNCSIEDVNRTIKNWSIWAKEHPRFRGAAE